MEYKTKYPGREKETCELRAWRLLLLFHSHLFVRSAGKINSRLAGVRDAKLIVETSDSGAGILEDDTEKVVTRFFRVRGVGLCIFWPQDRALHFI